MTTALLFLLVAALVTGAALLQSARLAALARAQAEVPEMVRRLLAEADCASTADLHTGLVQQTDRTRDALATLGDRLREALAGEMERMARLGAEERERQARAHEALLGLIAEQQRAAREAQDAATGRLGEALGQRFEALRAAVTRELAATRDRLEAMRLAQQESLAEARTSLTDTLAREGKEGRELLARTLRETAALLTGEVEKLARTTDDRLEAISGKVEERLEEGFKKTNETFLNVMAGLARIDEAQKKIDGLASNVVGLQEILGDKRARGAFGEVQLENVVRDVLPQAAFAMQHTFSTGVRADCALFLPEPTGTIAVDSKFPLESYRRMADPKAPEADRRAAERRFAADVRRHVDDIAAKYVIPGETTDGAVMFVPAESVFAEIHDRHPDLVGYAGSRRVWIVSPTTLFATLNTVRTVLKDVETRKQVHVIKENLGKLGKEFERFDVRMRKLADHIRLAHQDAEDVKTTSRKISERFRRIEGVEVDGDAPALPAGGEEESRPLS